MRKTPVLLAIFLGLTLTACGGGGGGGGGGDGGSSDSTVNVAGYKDRDLTKVYTIEETVLAAAQGKEATETTSYVYSYEQVDEVPAQYSYSGEYPGPYIEQRVLKNSTLASITYMSPSGLEIVTDNFSTYTCVDDNTYTGTDQASEMVLGRTYTSTTTQKLYNSDLDVSFWGDEIGTSSTVSSSKPLVIENVTVPAGTYSALKFQVNYTITTKTDAGSSTTEYTGYTWFAKGIGVVKAELSFSNVISGITVDYTVTDVLISVTAGG